jgi:hypothetical protein
MEAAPLGDVEADGGRGASQKAMRICIGTAEVEKREEIGWR